MRFIPICILLLESCAMLGQGISGSRLTPLPEFPRQVIIDTDPGIDDAMALLLALRSPELKVEAITVVAGNVTVDLGTENALKLVELAGRTDVVVAKGAAQPLQRKLVTAELIHGENGLGGVVLPSSKKVPDPRDAVQVIHDVIEANPGKITLVPIGPLTNIAMAFLEYPDLAAKTRDIVMMGGSVGAGNASPAAEANIYHDAEAAKVVFESGVPILMVDLTACDQARLTRSDADQLRASADPVAKFVGAISEPYLAFAEKAGSPSAAIHDALAVGIAIDPQIARTVEPIQVDVETKGEFTYGETVTNQSLGIEHTEWRGDRYVIADFARVKANASYPKVIDGQRFLRLFMQRMTHAPNVER